VRLRLFQEGDSRGAEGLGVGADVHLGDLDEILGIEKLADRDLLPDRPATRLAKLARQHLLFQIVQPHAVSCRCPIGPSLAIGEPSHQSASGRGAGERR
jgi:hypothetical protein